MGTVSLGKSGREDRTVLVFLLEALPAALTLCSFSLSTMGFFCSEGVGRSPAGIH